MRRSICSWHIRTACPPLRVAEVDGEKDGLVGLPAPRPNRPNRLRIVTVVLFIVSGLLLLVLSRLWFSRADGARFYGAPHIRSLVSDAGRVRWRLKGTSPRVIDVEARVPGVAHEALLAAGVRASGAHKF